MSIKIGMLAAAIAAVLWIGWPAPKETPSQAEPNQPMTVRATPTPASVPVKAPSKVDLNRASVDELTMLPGVGPVLAQRMVEWRKAHGRYRSVEDLQEVKGIGKKRMEQLRPLVSVTRIMYDSSSRNHAVASRDGRVETGEPEAYLKQYVEGASGEPVRLHADKVRAGASSPRLRGRAPFYGSGRESKTPKVIRSLLQLIRIRDCSRSVHA